MKYKKMKIIAILLYAIGFNELKAQESIPAAGGNATGSGGSVSYSVGQVVYSTITGASGSVAAGVQQTYDISVATGFNNDSRINLLCSAYPNPSTDFLTLKIEGDLLTQYTASLYSITGNLLKTIKVVANESRIDMTNLATDTYFLKIVNSDKKSTSQEIKTFKIIKN